MNHTTRIIGILLALATAAGASLGAEVDILLDATIDHTEQTAQVEVWLQSQTDAPTTIRMMRFDTVLTAPGLDLSAFAFDYSTIVHPGGYAEFFDWPLVSTVYVLGAPLPGLMFTIPPKGTLHAASLTVSATVPGTYTLDMANQSAGDLREGARLDVGLGFTPDDPLKTLWSGDGTLGGGTIVLDFAPEPGTLLMLVGATLLQRVPPSRRHCPCRPPTDGRRSTA